MVNQGFIFGASIFEKVSYPGTRSEVKSYVCQIAANSPQCPVWCGSFDNLEDAISSISDTLKNVLHIPGVEDPRQKTRTCHCCDEDEDD